METNVSPIKRNNEEEASSTNTGFMKIIITSFSGVFLAELGDKTQIATLLLSAQSGKPYIVFIGSAVALICSSLVAVLLGRWVAENLPKRRVTFMAGILMVTIGLWLSSEVIPSYISLKGF